MKRAGVIFLFLFSLLTGTSLFSQDHAFSIKGKIIDAETKATIKNASVRINGTLSGTVSDSAGNFELNATGVTVVLDFSILGYEKKSVKVNEALTDTLITELVRKTNTLSEVTINALPVQVVIKSKRYHVMDYEFYDDNILMITYVDLNKAKLVLITRDKDTLGFKKLPYEPNRLFRDCIGNIHVVCKDSLYQVYYNGKTLNLLPAKSIADFEKILLPCSAQDSSNFFMSFKYGSGLLEADGFHSFRTHNLAMNYYCINKKNRTKQSLIDIQDEQALTMRNDEDAFEDRKRKSGLSTYGDKTFAEAIMLKEIYAPLYNIDNRIYVFDYVNGFIKRFDKANQLEEKIPIDFHKTIQFSRAMEVDRKTGKAFALFESNGITEVKEINLATGSINASYKIPFTFVNQVKVFDNYIYFIHKGKDFYDDTRCLSRLKMN